MKPKQILEKLNENFKGYDIKLREDSVFLDFFFYKDGKEYGRRIKKEHLPKYIGNLFEEFSRLISKLDGTWDLRLKRLKNMLIK